MNKFTKSNFGSLVELVSFVTVVAAFVANVFIDGAAEREALKQLKRGDLGVERTVEPVANSPLTFESFLKSKSDSKVIFY